ncbi:hypothetical protein HHI36_017118 [Cryptolaemus montrouzieri]|uniref:PHD-type domain-containing protein n=1 Tax=Cryptolaemus montrouzieri TaxID=559131 RepID=A0ABD2NMC5_9CUCU
MSGFSFPLLKPFNCPRPTCICSIQSLSGRPQRVKMPVYCRICTKMVNSKDIKITCHSCNNLMHAACVNLSASDVQYLEESKEKFTCTSCQGSSRLLRSNSTSSNASNHSNSQPSTLDTNSALASIMETMTKFDTIAEDIASIKKSQKSLAEQVKNCNSNSGRHGGSMTNQDTITNEMQMLKSKLKTMDERIGSAGVDVSNLSRGS